jgi:hypothetical protein
MLRRSLTAGWGEPDYAIRKDELPTRVSQAFGFHISPPERSGSRFLCDNHDRNSEGKVGILQPETFRRKQFAEYTVQC